MTSQTVVEGILIVVEVAEAAEVRTVVEAAEVAAAEARIPDAQLAYK